MARAVAECVPTNRAFSRAGLSAAASQEPESMTERASAAAASSSASAAAAPNSILQDECKNKWHLTLFCFVE